MSHITQEQILNFAKESGFKFKNFNPPIIAVQHSNGSWISVSDELTAFANLVVAALAQPEPVEPSKMAPNVVGFGKIVGTYGKVAEWPSMLESQPEPHPDDIAVDAMAAAMKEKLAQARAKGRGGWETCSQQDLSRLLREHVEKGDPRDVANFCAFLYALGFGIEKVEPVELTDEQILKVFDECHEGLFYPQDMVHGPRSMRLTEGRAILAAGKGGAL